MHWFCNSYLENSFIPWTEDGAAALIPSTLLPGDIFLGSPAAGRSAALWWKSPANQPDSRFSELFATELKASQPKVLKMLTLNQSNCRWQEIPTHRKQGQARQKSHLRLLSLLTLGLEYSLSASLISCFSTQMPQLHFLLYYSSFSTPNYPLKTPYILQLTPLSPKFLQLFFLYSLQCPVLFTTPLSLLIQTSSLLQIFSTFSLWQLVQDDPLLANHPTPVLVRRATSGHDRMPVLCLGHRRVLRWKSNMFNTTGTNHCTVDCVLQGLCSTWSFQTAVQGNCHQCQAHHHY